MKMAFYRRYECNVVIGSAVLTSFECKSAILADAIRISDGSSVVLKQSDRWNPSGEVRFPIFREVYMFHKFTAEPLASDPTNHCIRLTETLHVPDDENMDIIVMPLFHDWQLVEFLTIGEVVKFFSQIFEVRSRYIISWGAERLTRCRAYISCIRIGTASAN